MSQPRVSVIIPAYQSARTIARPLKSLLAQSREPDEILVVDDGSTDDLAGAVAPFREKVTLLRKANGGAASARNFGIDESKGDFIAFLDADDYWEATKLERQLAIADGAGLVGSKWYTEYPGKARYVTAVPESVFYDRRFEPQGAEAFYVAMHCWTGAVLIRRDALGTERFVSGLEPAEDRDLWIRLAAMTSVYLISEPLATYVQYADSLSNSDVDRDCTSLLRVLHRYAALLGSDELRKEEAAMYRRWASRHLAAGRPRSAIKPARRRLAMQPTSAQAWWIMAKVIGRSIVP